MLAAEISAEPPIDDENHEPAKIQGQIREYAGGI